jgi:hypothetical protein
MFIHRAGPHALPTLGTVEGISVALARPVLVTRGLQTYVGIAERHTPQVGAGKRDERGHLSHNRFHTGQRNLLVFRRFDT